MKKVQGHDGLFKSEEGVIINKGGDREKYRRAKQQAIAQIERQSRVDDDLDELRNDINEIKTLLKQMLKP